MTAYIHQIETYLPPHKGSQAAIAQLMGKWSGDRVTERLIRSIFLKAGIETRHSVLPDFTEAKEAELFQANGEGQISEPTTQQRNRCYARYSKEIAVRLARKLVGGNTGFRAEDVTHVITVSCTGFANPGPDYHIVRELGLSSAVQRYNLGFMGCYAALPALRMAQQFCFANPEAVVLVACMELCSLHMQMKSAPDVILGNALFADGAAAALVSAQPPTRAMPALALRHFNSALAPEGAGDMAWEIGDTGFNLILSSYVPDVIATNINPVVEDLLSTRKLEVSGVPLWAIHPGGRAILDKVESALALEPWQIQASRDILRECGNMSSATILFVLARILAKNPPEPTPIVGMAFGPGLTIESALFEAVPARAPARSHEEALPAGCA